jgi:protein gp37
MGENTRIEWCDHTWNPWVGCQHVSPGCDHCYAERLMDHRLGQVEWGPHGKRRRTSPAYWRIPLRWARKGPRRRRPRVFCASLADVFDNQVPSQWRSDVFELIRQTPELDWLLLTKRPQNIRKMLPADWGPGWPNVWLGTTAEDQAHYDLRWPQPYGIPSSEIRQLRPGDRTARVGRQCWSP